VKTLSLRSHGVSHEVGREPARSVYVDRPTIHGFTAASGARLFPCEHPNPIDRPPGVARLVSSFVLRVPSPELLRLRLRSFPFGPSTLPGFLPSSRHHRARPLSPARIPTLATFRPQAIPASRRLSPRSGSGACFIPEPRTGPCPFRGFSLRAARRLVAVVCPLAVGLTLLGTNLPARPSTAALPRLRGFAPHGDIVRVVR